MFELFKDPPQWSQKFFVKDFLQFQTTLMKTVGMCHIDFRSILPEYLGFVSLPLNLLWFAFWGFLNFHLAILFIIDFLEIIGTGALALITNDISMIVINIFSFYTVAYFQLHHKEYLRIVQFMNERFLYRSARGLTMVTSERTYLLAKRCSVIWMSSCLTGVLQWVFVPLYSMDRSHPVNVNYRLFDQKVCRFRLRKSYSKCFQFRICLGLNFAGKSVL